MAYKMVVLDMDGTLLNDHKEIPLENKEVLKLLHQRGVHIVIATGRRYLFAKPVLETLEIPVVVVSNNGNALWLMDPDQKLLSKCIPDSCFLKILQEGHQRNLYPVLHVDHYEEGFDYFTEHPSTHPAYHGYIQGSNERHKVVENLYDYLEPKAMMMCYMGEEAELQAFQERVSELFPEHIHSHIVYSLTRLGPLLEITSITGTKWHTTLEYAQSLGISSDEIITIGDDNNDIIMIKNAGMGIAMKNATPEIKEVADIVSPHTHNEAGVAHILRKLFRL